MSHSIAERITPSSLPLRGKGDRLRWKGSLAHNNKAYVIVRRGCAIERCRTCAHPRYVTIYAIDTSCKGPAPPLRGPPLPEGEAAELNNSAAIEGNHFFTRTRTSFDVSPFSLLVAVILSSLLSFDGCTMASHLPWNALRVVPLYGSKLAPSPLSTPTTVPPVTWKSTCVAAFATRSPSSSTMSAVM